MIKIEVIGPRAVAQGPFPFDMIKILAGLRGNKAWKHSSCVEFDASQVNISLLKGCPFAKDIVWKIANNVEVAEFDRLATQHKTIVFPKTKYKPKLKLRDYQEQCIALSWERKAFALLLEMGLGKTAIMIANAGMLHLQGKLSGVLVLSPKGVHYQWLDEQVPIHIDPQIKLNSILWKKASIPQKEMHKPGLTFLSMNVDAVRTPKGFATARDFLAMHNGKSMMIVDESHMIKSWNADRTKASIKLGALATYRRISTGTPITKNVIDAWTQFNFLDKEFLGYPYMTSFRSRYCIMGGWEGRQIVGQKNVEEFYSLIAPHSFRLTKLEALDLPPKIYITREYEMGEKTEHHYNSIKRTFMTELANGEIVDVPSAAVALLRLQQIVCGYLPFTDDNDVPSLEIISNERLDVMMEIVEQVNGPVTIWARFIADIERIAALLNKEYGKGKAVTYYGATSNKDRSENKRKFLSGEADYFVSNPAAGGTGLNLQGRCQTVIYYSNSFNAKDRWQSEDRHDRIGSAGAITYFDLVARKTVDRPILRNLKAKKSISDLTLDQIRQAISMT